MLFEGWISSFKSAYTDAHCLKGEFYCSKSAYADARCLKGEFHHSKSAYADACCLKGEFHRSKVHTQMHAVWMVNFIIDKYTRVAVTVHKYAISYYCIGA